ncbi:MAG: MATE family efflux transporter [Oscillospiraceae bacterium]|nr:MATE family efflux transporter [Oscillospiraceae bacterium]
MMHIETSPTFYKKLIRIALPVALQNIIMIGVNLVDTIMLGALGETALSASSQANQFISLFMFMCMGIGMGTSVMTGRFWGAKDMVSLKKVVGIAYRVGLVLALIFTVINIAIPVPVMRLFSKEEPVIYAGADYLRWSTITYVLMVLSTVSSNVLRSVGVNHMSFIASLCSFGVNIGANYLFIFGKCGCPEMGVAGAALGTMIARVFEVGIICVYFFCIDKRLRFRIKDIFAPCADMLKEFLRISIPVVLSDSLLGLGSSMLAVIMGRIGSQFVAANAIANVVQRISTFFLIGIAHASCIMISQTLGEQKIDEAKKHGETFVFLGAAIGLVAAGVIMLIKAPVINAYNITEDTKQIAFELMNAISIIVFFRSANMILTKGVLRGGGDTKFLVYADTSMMWLIAIPLGALAGLYLNLRPFWVYICLFSDQIIKTVWCVFRLKSGKWIQKIRGVQEQNT